jgi:RNA polymerase sigma factor (sigma-70 family)
VARQGAKLTASDGAVADTKGVTDNLAEEDLQGPSADARICTQSDVGAQYKKYHQWLRDTAGRRFPSQSEDLINDAVSIVFVRLLAQADEGVLTDKGENWRPYLRRTVLNQCVDLIRKDMTFRNTASTEDPRAPRHIDRDPLGDQVADDDLVRRRQPKLNDAVANLSQRQVTLLEHVFDGQTNKQIGEALGISGQAIGQQLKTITSRIGEEVTKDE